jgi:hypothetical protein
VAGNLAPIGQAVSVPGGYCVSGHWADGNGVLHSAWIATGRVVMEDGAPRRKPDGAVDTRILFLPTSEVEIIDTWHVGGLRETGSHDYHIYPVAAAVSA